MVFANIEYLFLLLLLVPYIIWYILRQKRMEPAMQVSTTRMYMHAPKSWKLFASCSVSVTHRYFCDDCIGSGTSSDNR